MTDTAKHITAALAAIIIAATSMTAVVTVPPTEDGMVATVHTIEVA